MTARFYLFVQYMVYYLVTYTTMYRDCLKKFFFTSYLILNVLYERMPFQFYTLGKKSIITLLLRVKISLSVLRKYTCLLTNF